MKHSELFGIFSDPIECIPNPVLQGLGIKKRGPRRRRGPLFFYSVNTESRNKSLHWVAFYSIL